MTKWILRWETVHPFYRMKAVFDGHKKRDVLGSDYQKLLCISKNNVVQMYYWDEDLKRKAQEAKTLFLDKGKIKQYIIFAEKNAKELIDLSKKNESDDRTIVRKIEILMCCYDLSRPEYVDNMPQLDYMFPAAETILDKEEHKWAIINQKHRQGGDVSKELKNHAKKFGWMGTAEQNAPWDENHYKQLLSQNVPKREHKSTLNVIEKLGELRLRLRLAWVESGYFLRGMLREIPTTYAFLLDGDTITFYDESRMGQVEKLVRSNVKKVNVVRGSIAYPGKVKGRVKVINAWTPDQQKAVMDMQKGDILVTGMTRPHLIQAMHKAAAIITDEGGIASHAAILCREMRIPCIIGTKIATKVLKDGDLVEVDATKGVVKKLD